MKNMLLALLVLGSVVAGTAYAANSCCVKGAVCCQNGGSACCK